MRAPHALVCTALLALLCSGCATEAWKWRYAPDPPTSRLPLLDNTVAVFNLTDERSSEEYNYKPLCLLPLIFYATDATDKPDNIEANLKPTENIAKSLGEELANRRIFRSVAFSQGEAGGELTLRGKLRSTRIETTMYCYGISLLSVMYLPILGLPTHEFASILSFSLELIEPLSGAVLWQHDYKQERREKFNLLYASVKDLPPWEPRLLKDLMPQILSDLERAIKGMTTAAVERTREQ